MAATGQVALFSSKRVALTSAGTAAFAFWIRALYRIWSARRWHARRCYLMLTSSCEGSVLKFASPHWRWCGGWLQQLWDTLRGAPMVNSWRGNCPSCKRPIEARMSEKWDPYESSRWSRGKYAFVITLWGNSPDYILGALVLGYSIRRTGSTHARICMHTNDVKPGYLALLSRLWDCRPMEHVEARTDKLSTAGDEPHRFDKVFTKLRVLSLVEFEKVLLMDIDLLVTSNIDELFELQAPAALRRGMNDSWKALKTGDPVDGRAFFAGKEGPYSKWSWGQGTGINAGVMLLQPNEQLLTQMLEEISEPNHPSHAKGNGPEQDYLSRFWADSWSYIGVEYNYQLHQMFFALHPKWAGNTERAMLLREPGRIKIVHFSGVPTAKPWHRVLDEKFRDFWPDRSRDQEYTTRFADEFLGHWLWIRKDRASWEDFHSHHTRTEMQDLFLADDGHICSRSSDAGEPTRVDLPTEVTDGAMTFLSQALGDWFDCCEELQRYMGIDIRNALMPDANFQPVSPQQAPQPISSSPSAPACHDQKASASSSADSLAKFNFRKDGSWWVEQCVSTSTRLVVACGGVEGRTFVSFCEDGVETFGERDEPQSVGVFVKTLGQSSARSFAIPAYEEQQQQDDCAQRLNDALVPLKLWTDGVPIGTVVLVAIVNVAVEALPGILDALSRLGVPQEAPSAEAGCRAFAAIGVVPAPNAAQGSRGGWFGEKRGNASQRQAQGNQKGGSGWFACHASRDIAYVAAPVVPA